MLLANKEVEQLFNEYKEFVHNNFMNVLMQQTICPQTVYDSFGNPYAFITIYFNKYDSSYKNHNDCYLRLLKSVFGNNEYIEYSTSAELAIVTEPGWNFGGIENIKSGTFSFGKSCREKIEIKSTFDYVIRRRPTWRYYSIYECGLLHNLDGYAFESKVQKQYALFDYILNTEEYLNTVKNLVTKEDYKEICKKVLIGSY